jgi:hypothetical protein
MDNTQMDTRINNIFKGMLASGMPRTQAMAVSLAINHALTDEAFKVENGTWMVEQLNEFVAEAGAE